MTDFSFYEILGISNSASDDQIKSAYRNLASKFHPDKTNSVLSNEMMKKINQAYEILSDKKSRKKYDKSLEKNQTSNSTVKSKKSGFFNSLQKASKIYGKQAQIMGKEVSKMIKNYQSNSVSQKSKEPQEKSDENVIHHYHHFDDSKKKSTKKKRSKQTFDDFGFNVEDMFDL